jgi:hypothetical protein
MEGWACTCSGPGRSAGEPAGGSDNIEHAIRHFYAAGDAAGITLTLDDLSASRWRRATSRAARLRGAARNLTTETGAGLAGYRRGHLRAGAGPASSRTCPRRTLARTAPRAPAMTLDEAVAYAWVREPSSGA